MNSCFCLYFCLNYELPVLLYDRVFECELTNWEELVGSQEMVSKTNVANTLDMQINDR